LGGSCPTACCRDSAWVTGVDPRPRNRGSSVFSREQKGRACLGVFEGYPLLNGPPALPHEMPRITLFFDTLAQAANYRESVFLREVRITYLHELGHYLGWDEETDYECRLGIRDTKPIRNHGLGLSPRIATPSNQFRSRMRAQWQQEMNPVPGATGESERLESRRLVHFQLRDRLPFGVYTRTPRFPAKRIQCNLGHGWLRKESERNVARAVETTDRRMCPVCNALLNSDSEVCPVCALKSALESDNHATGP